jgi:succinate dehydrogenase/fumarate reductase flavoprotein subunit
MDVAPRNPLTKRAGIGEDPQQPRTYLKNELGARYDPSRVDAFLDNGPRMVAFFEEHTDLQFVDGNAISDIHGNVPGAGVVTAASKGSGATAGVSYTALPTETLMTKRQDRDYKFAGELTGRHPDQRL